MCTGKWRLRRLRVPDHGYIGRNVRAKLMDAEDASMSLPRLSRPDSYFISRLRTLGLAMRAALADVV